MLVPWLGQDFFPDTDSGQFILHVRAKTGTRIEETARLADLVETAIRRRDSGARTGHHPRQHRPAVQRHQPDPHGTGVIGAADADIMVSLQARSPPDRRLRRGDPRGLVARDFPA